MKYQVALSAPYPNVENVRKNPMDAKKLMNSYGGRNSETGAILTYAYQSYVVKKEHPELEVKTQRADGLRECRKLLTLANSNFE